jgi:ubiquinone/menaquinone biosynthesis C-methylase UbiE
MASAANDEVERWSAFRVWLYTLLHRDPKSNLAVIEHVAPGPADRLLDIGCGPGAALEHAAARSAEVAGVDPSPAMVERASERVPEADVKVGSAEALPFPDDRFNVVINISSYHHWANHDAGLMEVLRVLEPGGRLHIVERHHKRKASHGLTNAKADQLAGTLLQLGYRDSAVDTIEAGRSEYLVVSAEASGKPTRL